MKNSYAEHELRLLQQSLDGNAEMTRQLQQAIDENLEQRSYLKQFLLKKIPNNFQHVIVCSVQSSLISEKEEQLLCLKKCLRLF